MNLDSAALYHPRTNPPLFETQQISTPTLTGNWFPSLTQSHNIYAPYSFSSRLSCGSRNASWTHVFSCGHPYSRLRWAISFGKLSRSGSQTNSARRGSRQTVRLLILPPRPLSFLLTRPFPSSLSTDAKTVKSSILAFLALLSLSPVMKTLTASTSSDSIWALAACLFVLNALIADYSSPRPDVYARER